MRNILKTSFLFLILTGLIFTLDSCKKQTESDVIVTTGSQIIADHTVVNQYDKIPQQYIDAAKKMWLVVAGESHCQAYGTGLLNLETANPVYAVSIIDSGTP